ncbi:type II toxin-antitoxin system RelE/ParE family toxin [Neorhizobium sp. JUb45]|uniref:type II toxin-antitoxin system RelE/ParE family toxin n=1 Tax=unclassified Neorhizobium TaxID=2629175 RepID=UPI0010452097|nr:type II toxin-antitoxin system RelE/ParE family toxin [Neorhizobium sp. JUb45]TCR04281.1 plasmid stabilization system protein ParE [Neorhizobium sp. JUb45]
MKLRLSKNAIRFIRQEHAYLERFNPHAAEAVVLQLQKAFRLLADHPMAGVEESILPGRRHFVSGDYVISYRIGPKGLTVSYIRHGRQIAPDLEKDEDL